MIAAAWAGPRPFHIEHGFRPDHTATPFISSTAALTNAVPKRRLLRVKAAANGEPQSRGFGGSKVSIEPGTLPSLPPAPDLEGKGVRQQWNATALAYLGDSVWELYTRRRYFYPPARLTDYYDKVTATVCAEHQALRYDLLMARQVLTEEECDVLRWGKNAKVTYPKRLALAPQHRETYKKSTAMECLVGYLYLTDPNRLHELMLHTELDCNGS